MSVASKPTVSPGFSVSTNQSSGVGTPGSPVYRHKIPISNVKFELHWNLFKNSLELE